MKCDPLTEFDCGPAGCSNKFGLNYLDICMDTCIPKRFVNNGKKECADGSDEGMYIFEYKVFCASMYVFDHNSKFIYECF